MNRSAFRRASPRSTWARNSGSRTWYAWISASFTRAARASGASSVNSLDTSETALFASTKRRAAEFPLDPAHQGLMGVLPFLSCLLQGGLRPRPLGSPAREDPGGVLEGINRLDVIPFGAAHRGHGSWPRRTAGADLGPGRGHSRIESKVPRGSPSQAAAAKPISGRQSAATATLRPHRRRRGVRCGAGGSTADDDPVSGSGRIRPPGIVRTAAQAGHRALWP